MRFWREKLDPKKHKDYFSGAQTPGGLPAEPPKDNFVPAHAYFVQAAGYTLEFVSLAQVQEALEYFRKKVHPSTMEPAVHSEHYWQRWYERLPKGIKSGSKRAKMARALEATLKEYG
ncbi:MAG: hypothetical protein AAGA23_20670 [Pseudomonadota bacterium]